jgi:hypothetical protein
MPKDKRFKHNLLADPSLYSLTAEQVYAASEAEGLHLFRSGGTTGFWNVNRCTPNANAERPYQARISRKGGSLGYYKIPEQAALAVARALQADGQSHDALAHKPGEPRSTSKETRLRLLRSGISDVCVSGSGGTGGSSQAAPSQQWMEHRWRAKMQRDRFAAQKEMCNSGGGGGSSGRSMIPDLLPELPTELQLCVARILGAADLLSFALACTTMRGVVRRGATQLWHALLDRAGCEVDETWSDRSVVDAVGVQALYMRLCERNGGRRALEVEGLSASVDDANAGEQRAWWRCTAVGVRLQSAAAPPAAPTVTVRVHYDGYDAHEDEWRDLHSLRPYRAEAALAWRRGTRQVGDLLEVSALRRSHALIAASPAITALRAELAAAAQSALCL